jgi:hypothetical protein
MNLNLRLRFVPVNEEKSLVYLMFFESPFFVCLFLYFCVPFQSVGQINNELKNNTIPLSFKKDFFGAKKNSFNFLARKMIVSFFGGTSKDKIDDRDKFILKRMKVSYDRYEKFLHVVFL